MCYLGNPIVKNDCIGIRIGQRLEREFPWTDTFAIRGFVGSPLGLVTELGHWDRAILIDAVVTGAVPQGTVLVFTEEELRGHAGGSGAPHGINVAEALAMGRRLKLPLPASLILIGIEVEFCAEFGETISVELEAEWDSIYGAVCRAIGGMCGERGDDRAGGAQWG